MVKRLSFSSYIKDELAIVYPTLKRPENATKSQRIWAFIKQDVIGYFAPVRLLWRGIKAILKSL